MIYTCEKCLKEFPKKHNYTVHVQRKNPCIIDSVSEKENIVNPNNNLIESNQLTDILTKVETPKKTIMNNQCPHCKKSFYSKSNVMKHIENKSCKVFKNSISNQDMLEKIKELFSNHTKTITNNITTNNITNNTNNTNNITNNVNITIFSAGKEDLSRLTKEEIIKICTSGTYYPIVAAEIIHCNNKYPEFQNFLISNLRSNTGLVLINDKWVSKTQDEIISNIMNVDKNHVTNLIKDLKVDDKLQVKLESTKDEIQNNESKEHQKPKIKSRLYNVSKMVAKNKKIKDKSFTDLMK